MRYKTPNEEATPAEWFAYTRYGKKGDPRARYVPRKKGTLDLDEGDDSPATGPTKEEKKGSKTKVLLRGRVGPDAADNAAREVDILNDEEMPWKQEATPITVREGMARDGSVEPVARTPLSFHRLALVRGLGLRNFYPNFGEIFRDDLARKSPTMLRELNAIYGATASQASPETNLQRTLAVMAAGRYFKNRFGPDAVPTLNELSILTSSKWDANRHTPTERVQRDDEGMFPAGGITGADLTKVMRIWETGRADIGAGWKTPVFFQNILTSARNKFDWLSVPDTHMFRGRGYTMTGGSAPATVNQDLRALGITNATVTQLADEFGLEPQAGAVRAVVRLQGEPGPLQRHRQGPGQEPGGHRGRDEPGLHRGGAQARPLADQRDPTKPRLDAEGNPLLGGRHPGLRAGPPGHHRQRDAARLGRQPGEDAAQGGRHGCGGAGRGRASPPGGARTRWPTTASTLLKAFKEQDADLRGEVRAGRPDPGGGRRRR